jgi:hypothetical protein
MGAPVDEVVPSVAGSASEAGEEVGGLLGDGPDGSTTDRSPRSADQASGTIADGGSTERATTNDGGASGRTAEGSDPIVSSGVTA